MTSIRSAARKFVVDAQVRFALWVEPSALGLPNLRVLMIFPGLIALLFIVLVALGVSGSSTGAYWGVFGTGGPDPDLLNGVPRPIRSDEWLVQSSWVVSQVQQGFPVVNQTLPGGMDATVQNDLPSWDWSTLFRPHLLGFLALPLDQGMAIRWWLPGFAVVVGAYLFCVTMMPKRPVSAALLALAVYYTPIFQWWYMPTTLWPAALAFVAMAATIWCLRHPSLRVRIAWSAVTGYLAVTTAMSIYAPFIVPAALVILFFFVGAWIGEARRQSMGFRGSLRAVAPLIIAAVGAGVVLVVWIATRWSTIRALFATVYPGQRLEPTGTVDAKRLIGLLGGPFNELLAGDTSGAQGITLGPNQSEASSVVLYALFFLIPLIWIVAADWRRNRTINWIAVGVASCTVFVFAFLLIPGWDPIAHLLLVDRSTEARMRLAFVMLGIASIVVIVKRLDRRDLELPSGVVWSSVAVAAGSIALVAAVLTVRNPAALALATNWRITAILIVAAVFFVLKRWVFVGSAFILIAALFVGSGISPLYKGVFDLNDTKVGQAVRAIDDEKPGTWVGIGSFVPTAVLVESGVRALNGVQTYPPTEMWQMIDPEKRYENEWNRLANVGWDVGVGEPVVTNPVRDQIRVTLDPCSDFAQKNVAYVLSEVPLDEACAKPVKTVEQGPSSFTIYRVE